MSSEQANKESDILRSLGLDLKTMETEAATGLSAFGLDLDETLENPNWPGSEYGPDDSAATGSASSDSVAQPRTFPRGPGVKVNHTRDRLVRQGLRSGKDDPIFTFEAYGYEEKEERNTEASCFCFDTSAEIAIGKSKISGNNVVKLNRLTLKALEKDLRDLLTKDNYAHVHHCIETFLRVHIEEGKPLPVKIVRRLG
jgi:hypothetical protein